MYVTVLVLELLYIRSSYTYVTVLDSTYPYTYVTVLDSTYLSEVCTVHMYVSVMVSVHMSFLIFIVNNVCKYVGGVCVRVSLKKTTL